MAHLGATLVGALLPQRRGPGIAKPGWDEVGEPVIDVVVQPGDALVIRVATHTLRRRSTMNPPT